MKTDVFKAIADPTRRAILLLLASHAFTPTALAEHFDMTRQAVSKHIQVLAESGLVNQVPEGRENYYRLNPEKMKEAADWFEPFRQMWEARFDQLDNLLNNPKNHKL